MRKFLFYLLAIMFCGVTLLSQNPQKITGTVKGKVADSALKEPLAGATISLYNPKDSSLVKFKLSGENGVYEIPGLLPGTYRLKASFLGYESYTRTFKLPADTPYVKLRTIYLKHKSSMLESVVVEAPPILNKKDTVEFRAAAFAVKPNALAEDLLKRLPGIQVDKYGNLTAMGEAIKRVYVDGKEFFGSDPKIATRNITADMIESIQVYDDMSDQAKFTRIDDGSRSKSINIKLKKDKKTSTFGRLMAGAATDDRYESSLSLNRFNNGRQFTLLAGSNNLNNQAFSSSDNAGSGGTGSGEAIGIKRSSSAGINFANTLGKKLKVSGSYFYSEVDNRNQWSSFRRTFFPNDSIAEQSTHSSSSSLNQNHRASLRIEYFIDPNNSLLYTPAFTLQHSEGNNLDSTFTEAQNLRVKYRAIEGVTQNSNERSGINISNGLLFRHKYNKEGRTLTLGINHSINRSDGNGSNLSPLTFYNEGGSVSSTRKQDLITEQSTRSNNQTISTSYTEPISKHTLLEFNYAHTQNHTTSDSKAWDFNRNNGKYDQANLLQTNLFENTFVTHREGLNFRTQTKTYTFQLGGAIQQSALDNRSVRAVTGKDSTTSQTFLNFFPTANYQYSWSTSKSLSIRYNGRSNQPRANQLQDVREVSNPLRIVTGNPYLKQEFYNNVGINYRTVNSNTYRFLNINLTASNTYNKIVNSIEQDSLQNGAQLIRPVNLNGAMNASALITLGIPFGGNLKGSSLNFNNYVSYIRNVSLINSQKNSTTTMAMTQSLDFTLDLDKIINLSLNASLTYNKVNYSLVGAVNKDQEYYTQSYTTDISFVGLKNWVLSTYFDYYITSGLGEGYNQSIPFWNASIAWEVFRQRNGEFKFSVKDLLNQNQAIVRNVMDNYVEDVRSLVLRRYYLLTFTYNLKKRSQ